MDIEEMNMLDKWRGFTEALLVALIGVAIFSWIHIPLPWLIGSLVAVAVWSITTQRNLHWPFLFRKIAMVLLGYLIGTSFTKETLIEMGNHVPSMLAVTMLTIGFSLLLGYLFSKVTGLDLPSCMIGSVPGGLSQIMVLLDEVKGLNPTVITFLQTMRVMVIVIAVPITTVYLVNGDPNAAAPPSAAGEQTAGWSDLPVYAYVLYPLVMITGAWLFSRLRVPAALLLGPMVLTIALNVTGLPAPALPGSFIDLAQLFIGVHIGLQMQPRELPDWKKTMAYTFSAIVLLVLVGFGRAMGLRFCITLHIVPLFLALHQAGWLKWG
ncbi:AbrB family transcriptional regulator [Lentibacillus lipolyticus]|nr:AbrB family transcriptional regulator [Lentibacillus lipolyticus]